MLVTNKKTYSGSGIAIVRSDPKDHTGCLTVGPLTVAKGVASVTWTKSSNSTGTATFATGHGFHTGDYVDVYWSGAYRSTVQVGTVSGNSVPFIFDGGSSPIAGSNFPATSTALVVCKQVPIEIGGVFLGSYAKLLAMQFTAIGSTTRNLLRPVCFPDFPGTPILFTGDELKAYNLEEEDYETNPISVVASSEDSGVSFRGLLLSTSSTTVDALFRLISSFEVNSTLH